MVPHAEGKSPHGCSHTSASMYGNSDTRRTPTMGHLFPVTLAILATSKALSP